jgi:hypothetical protein
LQSNDTCMPYNAFLHVFFSCVVYSYICYCKDILYICGFINYNMWCLLCHKALLHFFFCIFWSFIGWKKSCLILHWVEEILFGPSLGGRNLVCPSLGARNLVWSFDGCKKSCLIFRWVQEILFDLSLGARNLVWSFIWWKKSCLLTL